MNTPDGAKLTARATPGAGVTVAGEGCWQLEIPPGPEGRYRLAQLDDTSGRARGRFLHRPPCELRLRARTSAAALPGTWGFGLWNDPFSLSLGFRGGGWRFPALPNALWFFFASPRNYLSLRDDQPAHGALAQVFASPRIPSPLLALAVPGAALLAAPPIARLLRRLARRIVCDRSAALDFDSTVWREYALRWETGGVRWQVDGETVFACKQSPAAPLGLVIWVDNQFAALPPSGKIAFGAEPASAPAWVEVALAACRGIM